MVALGAVSPRTSLTSLRLDVDKAVARFAPVGFAPFALSEALDSLLGLLVKHHVRMPATFASLLRALVITQGVAYQLDPQFDAWSFTADAVRRETWERLAPHQIFATLQSSMREWTHYLKLLPRQVSDLLLTTQAGGTQVRLEWEHADRYLHRLDIMVNRLSFAVVVAAIIIGSATILSSARASAAVGSPFAVGFAVVGAGMGLWLLYSVLRSGRL
jgi:ubiquinone biosynthesis protein